MTVIHLLLDAVSWGLIGVGTFFLIVSGIGLIRLPDFYSRLHGAGITDTLGAELMLFGMLLQAPDWLVAVKLAMIGIFLFFTSPTSTHAVANAAFVAGMRPVLGEDPVPGEDPDGDREEA